MNVAGFYLPPKSIKPNVELKISNGNDKELDEQLSANLKDKLDLSSENNHVNNISDDGLENTEESEELEDGDVEEGWITPSNLNEIQKQCIAEAEKQEIADFKIKVGCMTSDFSMQVFSNNLLYGLCKNIIYALLNGLTTIKISQY